MWRLRWRDGPQIPVMDQNTVLYGSVYAEAIDQWYVFEVEADTTFRYECLPSYECGEPISYEGYDYATVRIGDQCWFAENLRSANYENGETTPSNLSESEWDNTSSSAVKFYGSGSSECHNISPDGEACDQAWNNLAKWAAECNLMGYDKVGRYQITNK